MIAVAAGALAWWLWRRRAGCDCADPPHPSAPAPAAAIYVEPPTRPAPPSAPSRPLAPAPPAPPPLIMFPPRAMPHTLPPRPVPIVPAPAPATDPRAAICERSGGVFAGGRCSCPGGCSVRSERYDQTTGNGVTTVNTAESCFCVG